MSLNSGNNTILITESPRDAFQGIKSMIPAKIKASLINKLIEADFDIIDAGSFVSSSVIPQMADTPEVLKLLDLNLGKSKILVIAGNEKYAALACQYPQVSFIGFPFSVSETFLKLNINSDFNKAWDSIRKIQDICTKNNKTPVIFITMAFGNDYGDLVSIEIIDHWMDKITNLGIRYISLTDPPGLAEKEYISKVFSFLTNKYQQQIILGFHLHSDIKSWENKIESAFDAGIRWFDGVITGHGGCPMTGKPLVSNVSTSLLIDFFVKKKCRISVKQKAFQMALAEASGLFSIYT